jgi:hypothetical protein
LQEINAPQKYRRIVRQDFAAFPEMALTNLTFSWLTSYTANHDGHTPQLDWVRTQIFPLGQLKAPGPEPNCCWGSCMTKNENGPFSYTSQGRVFLSGENRIS